MKNDSSGKASVYFWSAAIGITTSILCPLASAGAACTTPYACQLKTQAGEDGTITEYDTTPVRSPHHIVGTTTISGMNPFSFGTHQYKLPMLTVEPQ